MKKVNKRLKKGRKGKNKSELNKKVVIKVQISKHPSSIDRMVIYNKTRKYTVSVPPVQQHLHH